MSRSYALLVEYDGAGFVGWQRQGSGLSVQQVLEEAAAKLNGGIVPVVTGSGRTDAGVHAEGQVAGVSLSADLPPERVREALSFHMLPHAVVVRRAAYAPDDWSPRFSAVKRGYRYRILNRAARPALDAGRVWHVPQKLDANAMHEAAQALLGKHDFSAFRAASCQARDALRTLDRLDVSRLGDEVVIEAEARSFLHHQVRNLVGTLAMVGLGKRSVAWPRALLDGRDRTKSGQTAPAEGLTFVFVRYAEALDWR